VSFIANELIENAMKFNDRASGYPISMMLQLYADSLVFLMKNSIPPETVERFQAFIQKIIGWKSETAPKGSNLWQ
jgi:hypothetical protein